MALPDLPPPSGGAAPARHKGKPTHSLQVDLSAFSDDQLLELRSLIDARLPTKALKDLNLEAELVLQMLSSQKLQRDVHADDSVPANQRAQVANSVASILAQIVKLQGDVYTSERLKNLEVSWARALNSMPEDVQRAFLDAYEAELE